MKKVNLWNLVTCDCGQTYEMDTQSEVDHMVWEIRRDGTRSNLGNCPRADGGLYQVVKKATLHGLSGRALYHGHEVYFYDGRVFEVGTGVEVTVDSPIIYSLSDCTNYSTNVRSDCGGRVENVDGVIICETCRNR